MTKMDSKKNLLRLKTTNITRESGLVSGASMSTNDLSLPSPANVRTLSVPPRHSILNGMSPSEAIGKYESELTALEISEIG